MIIFPFVFATLLFLALIFRSEFRSTPSPVSKKRFYFLNISFFILLFFHVFKDPYSLPDLDGYITVFDEIKRKSLTYIFQYGLQAETRVEPGWIIYNKTISLFGGRFLLLAITGGLILLGPYKVIKKYCPSKYVWLAVMLFFTGPYLQSIFVIRQHLAISICLLSIPYILKKRLIKYLIVCALAVSIHYSAVLWLPIYFFYHINREKVLFVAMMAFAVVIITLYSLILPYVGVIVEGFSGWVEKNDDIGTKMTESLMMGSVFAAFVFSLRNHVFDKGVIRLFFILLSFALIFSIAGIGFIQTGRLNMYFTRLVYIYIPLLLYYIKRKSQRTIIGIFLSSLFILVWLIHAFDMDVDYNHYELLFW